MSTMMDDEIAALAYAATAEIQVLMALESSQLELTSEELAHEREEDEQYFEQVAKPLGEATATVGIMGSEVIIRDRGN
jgi:hypothetical protein